MQLILFRHGIAEDVSPDGSDFARRLTDEGVTKTKQAAAGLVRCGEEPDVILTSPLVRARQTAAIVGEAFGVEPQVFDVIAQPDPAAIIDAVRRRGEDRILIVGHEPTFSAIIETLVAGRAGRSSIQMKKAGAACLTIDRRNAGHAELEWLATPKMLRDMA